MNNTTDILTAYDTLYALRSELGEEMWTAIIGHIDGLGVTDVATIAPVEVPKPKPAKKAPAPKAAQTSSTGPTPTTEGKYLCEVCGARFTGPASFGAHIKANHWADVVDEYELNGAVGLQREFGVSTSTSYNWAKKIEKAAA